MLVRYLPQNPTILFGIAALAVLTEDRSTVSLDAGHILIAGIPVEHLQGVDCDAQAVIAEAWRRYDLARPAIYAEGFLPKLAAYHLNGAEADLEKQARLKNELEGRLAAERLAVSARKSELEQLYPTPELRNERRGEINAELAFLPYLTWRPGVSTGTALRRDLRLLAEIDRETAPPEIKISPSIAIPIVLANAQAVL